MTALLQLHKNQILRPLSTQPLAILWNRTGKAFDLRISNVHTIGGVAMSDMEIKFVSVGDLPNLKIEFDVVVDAEIEVTEGDYHYDDYDICNQWLTVRCAGDQYAV